MVEPQPQGAGKRASAVIRPCMGRTSRVVPSSGKYVRGVFSRPGVEGGALFAVVGNYSGSTLYQISTSWAATALGSINGTSGTVLFDSLGTKLAFLASGTAYEYSTSAGLQVNTDANFPSSAATWAALAERAITNDLGSDQFSWSATGSALSWPAAAFATSGRQPDPIVANAVAGGELYSMGAASVQVWRAQGGDDPDVFDPLSIVIDRGLIGLEAWARVDSSIMFIGDDRVVYLLNNYQPQRVSNRAVEIALAALTATQASALQCFSYMEGSHLTWIVRMPSGQSYAYDLLSRTWSERTTWGATRYAPSFYSYFHAAGKHVVASDADDDIWSWDVDTYTDNSGAHERIMMLHVPVAQRTIISSITLDIKCTDVPLTGTGSAPTAHVTFYKDGGSRDSLAERGVERVLTLGPRGMFGRRPTAWRLGLVNSADGMVIKIRITDPVNFALSGVWINENPT